MKNTRSLLSLFILVLSVLTAACTFTLPEPGVQTTMALETNRDLRKPENARVPYGPGRSADDHVVR